MYFNSNDVNSPIGWVCADCGSKAKEETYGKNKPPFGCSTYHVDTCSVCGKNKACTEARDFYYPVFNVEDKEQQKKLLLIEKKIKRYNSEKGVLLNAKAKSSKKTTKNKTTKKKA